MKMDVTLAVPGLPFNGNTFDKQSLGGSETAGYYMGRALAKRGHRVMLFCSTEERVSCADVDYLPIGMFASYVGSVSHDACIIQRAPELLANVVQSKFTALWCHDLALGRMEGAFKGVAWNYDKVFVLSEFMRQQYMKALGLSEDVLFLTRNGLDLDLVKRVREELAASDQTSRNPLALVYTSRPERGLDVLLQEVMPRILKYEPQAKLFLAGYDNHPPELQPYYQHCQQLAARLGDCVTNLGHLDKAQLYTVYQRAGLLLYPLPSLIMPQFDEVSCITAMEAQACGLPIVTSRRGALPETIAEGAGVLVDQPIHTEAYYDAFADAALRLMRNPAEARKASEAGILRAEELSWDAEAGRWEELILQTIEQHNDSKQRLANHFYRHSDIFAARKVLEQIPADDIATSFIRERIAKDFAFMDTEEGMREQYEKIGATHDAAVINWSPTEPRFAALQGWLTAHPEINNVLDYGCAHGGYAINLLERLPHLHITGMDLDLHGIQMASHFAVEKNVQSRWTGVVGGHARLADDTVFGKDTRAFDAALAQEVLEHVIDPVAVLRAIESRVKDGGIMYVTVPFGPWEYTDYQKYPYRAHVREIDSQDLHDMVDCKGAEAQVTITAMLFGSGPVTAEPLGWWVMQYVVNENTRGKFGEINYDRKLSIQRPRQTLSAAIIAGPNCEETLHWNLRSLVGLVDEVVIANCGMSQEALRILETYRWRDWVEDQPIAAQRDGREFLNIRVVPGVDPKAAGFEAPRNIALSHCTQDWVLWIDTDEKVLQPDRLHKYLRKNIFQGYSIHQHHFAVDTKFDADLPVRVFRNNGKLRFFGMIHEHPEASLNSGPGMTIVLCDVHIPHLGYLIESGRRIRFSRNYPLLEADIAKYPERKLQKHFIMRDEMLLASHEFSINGNRVTDSIRARCDKVIKIYREHFCGVGSFANIDPITYYSQACIFLNIGFDTMFSISADKVNANPGAPVKIRFANEEDFMAEMKKRAADAVRPFTQTYW